MHTTSFTAVVHLMAQMLEPKAGETIYDPTCGTGGMLISCLAEVKHNDGDTRTIGLYGQELINITAAIARISAVDSVCLPRVPPRPDAPRVVILALLAAQIWG